MAASQASNVQDEYTAQSDIDSITYKWTIKNFTQYTKKEVGFYLISPTFAYRVKSADEIIWYIVIYPNGVKKEDENHVGLFLCPSINEIRVLPVNVQWSILNSRCEQVYESQMNHSYHTYATPSFITRGRLRYIAVETLLDKAKGLLPNDALTICCKINAPTNKPANTAIKKVPKCCLGDNLSDFFNKQLLSDVTLTAQDEEFKAHKIILAARSKVFAAMFLSDMKENAQNIIEIVDIDKEVLRNLLHYIYSGELPNNKTVPAMSDLLAAADKYDLERLKILCEKDLCFKLTVDNVAELLILANLCDASELKSFAMDFVNRDLVNVMRTETWMTLVDHHPRILNEVLAYHLECNRKNKEG